MRLPAIMRTRSSCSSRLDRRGLAQAGGAAGRGAGVQTHEASGTRRLAGVTRGVPTAGARTVPVEDAEESHSLLAPLWPERVADATAVLVYLRGGLALTHARLNAVARVRANGLEREGQQGLRLDDAHLRAAREKHQKKALEASRYMRRGLSGGVVRAPHGHPTRSPTSCSWRAILFWHRRQRLLDACDREAPVSESALVLAGGCLGRSFPANVRAEL